MCKVALSEVTARRPLLGEMAREKMAAGSTPRLSSEILAQLAVEKSRISVPVSEAVARISPFGLKVMAFSGELCAGIMLTFPVLISTSWT